MAYASPEQQMASLTSCSIVHVPDKSSLNLFLLCSICAFVACQYHHLPLKIKISVDILPFLYCKHQRIIVPFPSAPTPSLCSTFTYLRILHFFSCLPRKKKILKHRFCHLTFFGVILYFSKILLVPAATEAIPESVLLQEGTGGMSTPVSPLWPLGIGGVSHDLPCQQRCRPLPNYLPMMLNKYTKHMPSACQNAKLTDGD